MDLEKLLPILFLVIWSIFASQARKKKKQQAQRQGRQPERPSRTTQRPPRQEPQRPSGSKPKTLFQDLRKKLEEAFEELGEPVRQGQSSTATRKQRTERPQKERPATKATRIEKTQKRRSTTKRTSLQDYGPEVADLEAISRAPDKLAYGEQEATVDIEELGIHSPRQLRRAVIWSEIIGKPVSLRNKPFGMP
jgi:hypothetical protein